MVYCHNCGTKNDDDAEYCSKCGTPLKESADNRRHREEYRHRQRNQCFGLPHGNLIGPLIIGAILILVGLSSFYGFQVWTYIWPAIIILVGLLIVVGAIFGYRNREKI
ncbi:MAG TPA: zinc-ribbon domain-containing protein [Methanobacteriaceae archaeon]|nr:zinc-ribbon domain-containing protein [Methanobacteriaceae archaeon]